MTRLPGDVAQVSRALERLAATSSSLAVDTEESFLPLEHGPDGAWHAAAAPLTVGQLDAASPVVRAVFDLPWPQVPLRLPDDEPLEIIRAPSEQYAFRRPGRTLVARVFAFAPRSQVFYALDLAAEEVEASELTVYRVEHDGSDWDEDESLLTFLESLSVPPADTGS